MGEEDQNDGEVFRPGLMLDPVVVDDPDTQVLFDFSVFNAGNTGDVQVKQTVDDLAKKAAVAGVGALLGTSSVFTAGIGALVGLAIIKGLDLFFANCDGPVILGHVEVSGATLNDIAPFHSPREAHRGSNSGDGCGGNSLYFASWAVLRT